MTESGGFPYPGGGRFVGARVKRAEDPRLLTGEARYAADIQLPGMLAVAFVRATEAHARIESIDVTEALSLPGAVAVLTAADLDVAPVPLPFEFDGLAAPPQPALARNKVRFLGEPVAVVVAENRYQAEDIADRVRVRYDRLGVVVSPEAARAADAPLLFEDLGTNVLFERTESAGDVEGAFAEAAHVFRKTFHTNRFVACPMEGRGVVAHYEPRADHLKVWSSTQTPFLLRTTLAAVLPYPEHRLQVIVPEVGGGFGAKMSTYPEEVAVAAASLKLGRPLSWIEDRRENLLAANHAKEQQITLELALDTEGQILALRAEHVGDAGAYNFNSTSCLIEPFIGARNLPGVLRLRNYEWTVVSVATNRSPVGAFRAVGSTPGSTTRDAFLDEIARQLGIDVVKFFRKNMIRADEMPYHQATGQVYDSGDYIGSLDQAVELVDYAGFRRRQEEARSEGRYLGIGFSPFVEATGWGSEIAKSQGLPFSSHDNASVSVDPSGMVTVATSMASQGQGHETSFAQVAADVLGVDVATVRVTQGDTDVSPYGMGTFASRSAIIGGGSVLLAAEEVRKKVLAIAAKTLEASAEDLEIADGRVAVKGAPQRGLSYPEVAAIAHWDLGVRSDDDGHRLAATRFYDPPATFSNGCFVALVEVDPELGTVKLEKIVGVEDCGRVINPMIVEGQSHGAVAQAVGGALLEHMVYDENGGLITSTFMDYLLPTALDVPPIEIAHMETLAPHTAGGFKGMGEGGLMSAPGAIVCAVVDALSPFGAVLEELPLGPEQVARMAGSLATEGGHS
ncbi:MAG: xanthine dehydrogenase family protein [Actinobacteria bacterium]|nr:xanthine dehydrogenase family protein [Actinomycetota bacterium]